MKPRYWVRVIVRDLAMATILVMVWFHAHWSVALCISLLSVAAELRNIEEEIIAELAKRRIA